MKAESVPGDLAIRTVTQGVTFFIEEQDQWHLQEKELIIDAQGIDIRFVLVEASIGEQ
jgi:uncharacterized protein YneR